MCVTFEQVLRLDDVAIYVANARDPWTPVKNRKKGIPFLDPRLISAEIVYKCKNEKNIFQFDSFPSCWYNFFSFFFFWKTKFEMGCETNVMIVRGDPLFILLFFFFFLHFELNYLGKTDRGRTLAILNRKRIAFDGGFTKFRLRDRIPISRLLEDKGQSKVLASRGRQTESKFV